MSALREDEKVIVYFVCGTEEKGIMECMDRGWRGIARLRYVTPEKHDVRIVARAADLHPLAGRTPMVRGGDYAEDVEFEKFVAEGNGEWVEL